MADPKHTPASSTSSTMTSPRLSLWSRGHSSKSSASSMSATSSPVQARDSLDLYGSQKRLEDVREEEDFPSRHVYSLDDSRRGDLSNFANLTQHVSPFPEYTLADQGIPETMDAWSTTSSGHHHAKRQRSLDRRRNSATSGFATRFNSLSRRLRNRSSIGPPLSIITNTTPVATPRTSLDVSNTYHSRTTSVASNTHCLYSPVSMRSFAEDTIPETEVVPLYIDRGVQPMSSEEDQALATTPLLPPTMINLQKQYSPIQSPLQSPSIAATPQGHSSRQSMDQHPFSSYLPSPPLSARPSMASMPRTRANTAATQDIPNLQQLGEKLDPLSIKLGHADFDIHPEPYRPNIIDLDSFKEFRENWAQARKAYAQHLARTTENYGETSKIFKLTEEKWTSIDQQWKEYDDQLSRLLSPQLQRLSDDIATPDSPVSLLDRPVTRVVVPQLDKSGKFPEIGDTDIVGPMSVGVSKVPELQRGALTPPTSPRKRSFIKTLEDIFKRH